MMTQGQALAALEETHRVVLVWRAIEQNKIIEAVEAGVPVTTIARTVGLSRSTIHRLLRTTP
jgi:transcriptional regulator of acetoin/glycerol metabolism